MALIPVTIYGNVFTASETTFLQGFADLAHNQGDIFYVNSSGQAARLAAGTSGYFLKTQGANADPIWASVSGSGINPQVPSGTVNSSNKSFTCTGLVSVAFADGTVDVGAVISGSPNSSITYSVPPQNNVYAL